MSLVTTSENSQLSCLVGDDVLQAEDVIWLKCTGIGPTLSEETKHIILCQKDSRRAALYERELTTRTPAPFFSSTRSSATSGIRQAAFITRVNPIMQALFEALRTTIITKPWVPRSYRDTIRELVGIQIS